MGGGGGGFAFQIDDELDAGESNPSATFGSPQLSSNEFFRSATLLYRAVVHFYQHGAFLSNGHAFFIAMELSLYTHTHCFCTLFCLCCNCRTTLCDVAGV